MKNAKKGFTLAELLIVIAIIAILIAIAIPAFSASLNSAKLQTDHANIRSAYSMMMTARMLGTVETEGGDISLATSKSYYFTKSGKLKEFSTFTAAQADAYVLQANASKEDCATSMGCGGGKVEYHKANRIIMIVVDSSKKVGMSFRTNTNTYETVAPA